MSEKFRFLSISSIVIVSLAITACSSDAQPTPVATASPTSVPTQVIPTPTEQPTVVPTIAPIAPTSTPTPAHTHPDFDTNRNSCTSTPHVSSTNPDTN